MSFTLSPQLRVVALAGLAAVLALGGGMFVLGHHQPASSSAPALNAQELIKRAHAAHPGTAHAKKVAHTARPAHAKTHAKARPGVARQKPLVHATPKVTPKPKPKPKPVSLYQNLPGSLLAALQRSQLVVAVLYNPQAPDDQIAVAEAQAGAREVGAGFVGLNVLSQADVGQITRTYGLVTDPAVLVFRRPGVVIGRLDGFADRSSVAQAVEDNAPDDVRK